MMSTYRDLDVNEDPIIVLPCKHFYSTSTLDGHLSLKQVYNQDPVTGKFTSIRPLHEADVDEKPKSCPDCRNVIHSVQRYGRLLRLTELRSLERKHLISVNDLLNDISRSAATVKPKKEIKKMVNRLKAIEQQIMKSPMRKVYEACLDQSIQVPQPPTRPLLHTLQLLGKAHTDLSSEWDDEHCNQAKEVYGRGIDTADLTQSIVSGGHLRLGFCSLLAKLSNKGMPETMKEYGKSLIQWILDHGHILPLDMLTQAKELESVLSDPLKEMREVLMAMNVVQGFDYGGSWSSHWYQCPNGHYYFIGECGGAMQESRCIECGAVVGGQSHSLNPTNRPAGGILAEALRR
jgi:hypothetical protein